MKESIGFTVILNIVITFIIIVFAFLSAILIYYRSNKVSNVVTNAIEKYEGFNDLSIAEINIKTAALGYSSNRINCASNVSDKNATDDICTIVTNNNIRQGFCVYLCNKKDSNYYYYYKVRTNMMINIPIINELLGIPVYSTTNNMYNFEKVGK